MSDKTPLSVLKNLRAWLQSGQKLPASILPDSPSDSSSLENLFDMPGEGAEGEDFDDPDAFAKLQMLQIFFGVLDNRSEEEKEIFFQTITKMMDSNDPSSLSKDEHRFMLGIVEEAIFSIDEDAPHYEA